MRFIFPAVILMTSVSATTMVEPRNVHNAHPYKRTHFEHVINYYSKNINNKYDAYKFIELISTGKGTAGYYSFNGIGSLGTYEEHDKAFKLLQEIGFRFGSNFYISHGDNYDFVRTALNKWFEESKGLSEKSKKKDSNITNGFKKLEEIFKNNDERNKRDVFNKTKVFETKEYKNAKKDWENAITIKPNGWLPYPDLALAILAKNILSKKDIRKGWSKAITTRSDGWLTSDSLAKAILAKNILTEEEIREGWSKAITIRSDGHIVCDVLAEAILDSNILLTKKEIREVWKNAITIRPSGWLTSDRLAKAILAKNILTEEEIREGWGNAINIGPNGCLAGCNLAEAILAKTILTEKEIREGWSKAITIRSDGQVTNAYLARAILDLGIIDADSVREKFKEIKESNRSVDYNFIKSILKSKRGDLFNFSNDEIIELYRLQNQNGRPNTAHIVSAAEDIMRNQRPYLRRHIDNINNLNVGNNWGANETIMNAVHAIDEIKIFYSGEEYKENAEKMIDDELEKFSSPKKSLKNLIAEFGCDGFSKTLNDFDAKLNKINEKEYSVDNRIEILREIYNLKKELNEAIKNYTEQNIKKITKYKELYAKFNKDEKIENKSEEAINSLIRNEFYKNFYTDYFEKIINGILIETQLKRSEKILPMIVDIVGNTHEVIVIKDTKGEEQEIPLKGDFENFFNGMVDAAIANNDNKREGEIGDTCQFDKAVQSALKSYVPFIELFNLGADVGLNNDEFEVWKKMQGMCKDFEKIINPQCNFEVIADASGFNKLPETPNKTLLKERTERYISFVQSNVTEEILKKLKIANEADDKFFESIEKEMNILTCAISKKEQIDDSIDSVLGKVEDYIPSKLERLLTNDVKKIYIREFIKGIFSVFSVNYENLSYEKSMNGKIEKMFEKMGLSKIEFEEKRSNDTLVKKSYEAIMAKAKEAKKDKSLEEIVSEIYEMFGGDPDPSIEGDTGSSVTKEEIRKIVENIKSKEGKA